MQCWPAAALPLSPFGSRCVIMLNQHYLGIHACVMRLEIAVQVGGAKTICDTPAKPGNQIKRRRVESHRVSTRLDSCGPIKVYYACSKLQLVAKPAPHLGHRHCVWFYAFSIRTTTTMACHLTWAVIQSDRPDTNPPPIPLLVLPMVRTFTTSNVWPQNVQHTQQGPRFNQRTP